MPEQMENRCAEQYNAMLKFRWALAEIENKKQKLIAMSPDHAKQHSQVRELMDEHTTTRWHVHTVVLCCILQLTRGTALALTRAKVEDTLVFNQFPTETLHGKKFRRLTTFDCKEMNCDFEIVKVCGYVKWKHNKSENSGAKLKLARFHENGTMIAEIQLAQYVHAPNDEGWTEKTFTFVESDAGTTSPYPFWNRGAAGKICMIRFKRIYEQY